MALVVRGMSISLDGYVTGASAGPENPFGDGAGMLHDWIWETAANDDRALLQEAIDNAGALVMGYPSMFTYVTDGVESATERLQRAAGEQVVR